MELRKIYIIIIVLIVLLAGVISASIYFGRKTTEQTSNQGTEQIQPEQEETESTKNTAVKNISLDPILAPIVDHRKIKYYSPANSQLYQSNLDGSIPAKISDLVLSNFLKIIWSPDKTKFIYSSEQNDQIKKYLYEIASGQAKPLNENIQNIAWSPDSSKIAYYYYNSQSQENNISTADPDGANWKNIFKTKIKELIIEWPSQDKISLRTRPSGLAQTVLYLLEPQTGRLTKILDEIYGFTVNWSPKGDKFIYSSTNERGNRLKLNLFDLASQKTKTIGLSTIPEKCVWSQDNQTIFCAIPHNESGYDELPCPADKTLPDDWYKGSFTTSDDFFKINLQTNEKNLLLRADQKYDFDAEALSLTPAENLLFFLNKKDNLLYSLEIK